MNRRNPTAPSKTARNQERQRGSIVVYLALSLVVFGVLAMAGANRFGASMLGVAAPNCATQARLMAESGARYAMTRLRTATDQATLTGLIAALNGQTYTVDAAKGLKFSLSVGPNGGGNAQVNATGSACGGVVFLPSTSSQASVSVNVPAVPGGGGEVTFANVGNDFFRTTDLQSNSPISVDPATKSMSFGILGQTQNAAAIWYNGNATGGCVNGNCTMTYGLRAYFDVLWTIGSFADGLVFGILSAETNKVDAVGGTKYQGELMGWGGPGTSGVGVQPPKIGLEFDTYFNGCDSRIYVPGSRCDATTRDHLAYVFWGTNTALNTTYTYDASNQNIPIQGPTYDDNRHGAGAGNASEPISLADPDGTGSGRFGYYYGTYDEWLKGRAADPPNGITAIPPVKYGIRYELSRIGTKNSEGNYPYVIKSWVRSGTITSPYNDVTKNYTAAAPTMQRVVHLTPALHAQLGHVLFGWTEATGASTQKLTVSNFNLVFKSAAETLAIPQDYVSYWNMNAGSGATVADSNATNHNDGTIVPLATSVTWLTPATPANYPYGKVLSFSGDTGRVSVPDSNSLDQLSAQGTIAAWIYPTALTDNTYILHKGNQADTSDEAYSLRFSTGGKLELRIRYGNGANSYVILESSALPAANRWYHVVAQWDSGIFVIYINGMLNSINTNANNRAARTTAGNLVIGARHTASAPYNGFNGYIDEVYLYNHLITAEEVAALSLMP